ncbi:hypothetical protein FRC12_008210 [Ceratobasidium sp. 428]|nr:hypothetical protein FRC12_008210 [Ceratobasidium sp. 428]
MLSAHLGHTCLLSNNPDLRAVVTLFNSGSFNVRRGIRSALPVNITTPRAISSLTTRGCRTPNIRLSRALHIAGHDYVRPLFHCGVPVA